MRTEFCIPTLISGDAVVKIWEKLKASAKYKDWQREGETIVKAKGEKVAHQKFNAAWNERLNDAIADAFPVEVLPPKEEQSQSATYHCLRAAYAALANRRDNPEEPLHSILFIGTAMGQYLSEHVPSKQFTAKALGNMLSDLVYEVPSGQSVPFVPSPLANPSKSIRVYHSEHEWLVSEQSRLRLGNQGDALALVRQRLNQVTELEVQLHQARSDRDKAQQQRQALQPAAEPLAAIVKKLRQENQQLRTKAALSDRKRPQSAGVEANAEELKQDRRQATSSESEAWVGMVGWFTSALRITTTGKVMILGLSGRSQLAP